MADQPNSLLSKTKRSVAAAKRDGIITAKDAGAVQALLELAVRIDAQDAYFQALLADAVEHGTRPPSMDNVSLPTYLKYCDALGLTPAGRKTLELKEAREGGRLAQLRTVHAQTSDTATPTQRQGPRRAG